MGRGVAYKYEQFMLIDQDYFIDENNQWDDYLYENFIDDIKEVFKLDPTKAKSYREVSYLGETQKLFVGIDGTGGLPCIFVEPQTYIHISGNEKEYKIKKEVCKKFNKLIKMYPNLLETNISMDFVPNK